VRAWVANTSTSAAPARPDFFSFILSFILNSLFGHVRIARTNDPQRPIARYVRIAPLSAWWAGRGEGGFDGDEGGLSAVGQIVVHAKRTDI
jgi:hypothetical protein